MSCHGRCAPGWMKRRPLILQGFSMVFLGRRTVLDDECLAQPLLQFVPNRARDQIGAATRSERHQDRHAVRRIILSSRVTRPCGERDDTDDDPTQYDIHRLPSLFASAVPCGKQRSCGSTTTELYSQMGIDAGKILNGAKPVRSNALVESKRF